MLALWALTIIYIKWKRIKEQTTILDTNIFSDNLDEKINLKNLELHQEKLDKKGKGFFIGLVEKSVGLTKT